MTDVHVIQGQSRIEKVLEDLTEHKKQLEERYHINLSMKNENHHHDVVSLEEIRLLQEYLEKQLNVISKRKQLLSPPKETP
jgi:hypothetical protein